MRVVAVRDESIRLGQFLKVAGLADSGADAASVLATGDVTVNGDPEQRRGRQLHRGDVVVVGGETVRVGPVEEA